MIEQLYTPRVTPWNPHQDIKFYLTPILQMRKQWLRDLKWLSQDPTVNRLWAWHWDAGVPGLWGAGGPASLAQS